MNNQLIELVFILDRSGSMHGLEKDTLGGFNSMMEKQKREKEMHWSPQSSLIQKSTSFMTGCP